MKDLNPTTSVPRATSRFRPLSLPVYLDYRTPKRHMAVSGDSPPSPLHSISPKTPGFHISGIPRMLRPGARTILLSKPSAPLDYRPQQNESRCCQMLMHGLFVAFDEDDFVDSGVPRNEDLLAEEGRPFTHFISLSTRHKTPIRQSVDRKTGAQRLRLQLPQLYDRTPPSAEVLDAKVLAARDAAGLRGEILTQDDLNIMFDEGEDTRFTGLDALQLIAARDFLFGASLPSGPSDPTTVRVLVTTPRDHRTDAIAAVMGYLSIVLRRSVQKILQVQDGHSRVLTIWKNTLSEECAEFIEDVCHL
ncbi:hypothetical protein FB45DRAFT_930743 [Roridomyces roridus]|uniref:Uncharacterized protein n=1 Tax=Roridomyces roridus TaxID=1738132 RepID=A0AAD7BFE6_9AGAR|nr:hypothetical protein FB45DRAFT_930743 [Roridomyces roridus]